VNVVQGFLQLDPVPTDFYYEIDHPPALYVI
jgi:hypothetical protein